MLSAANTSGAVGAAITMAILGLVTCSSEQPAPQPACVKVDTSCAPLYAPTYDEVFTRTLAPTCGKSGVSCHSTTGHQGGLAFEDADTAFRLLGERGVVRAGDPACSEIVRRVTATDGNVRMPPGISIPAAEQCSIIQWIANGAKR